MALLAGSADATRRIRTFQAPGAWICIIGDRFIGGSEFSPKLSLRPTELQYHPLSGV